MLLLVINNDSSKVRKHGETYEVAGVRFTADQIPKIDTNKLLEIKACNNIIDFGQNLTGWIETKTDGKPGEELHLRCFETLDAEGNVARDYLATEKGNYLMDFDGNKVGEGKAELESFFSDDYVVTVSADEGTEVDLKDKLALCIRLSNDFMSDYSD